MRAWVGKLRTKRKPPTRAGSARTNTEEKKRKCQQEGWWEGEKKRITEILDQFSTFKKIKDFHKTLYIPIEFLGKK